MQPAPLPCETITFRGLRGDDALGDGRQPRIVLRTQCILVVVKDLRPSLDEQTLAVLGPLQAFAPEMLWSLSPSSIKAYLTSNNFVRVGRSLYRTRGSIEHPKASTRVSLEETGSCFLLNQGWALRLKLNEGRLRGSGVGIPQAFAQYIGLAPNEALRIPVTTVDRQRSLGYIRFSWPAHVPTIGSITHTVTELQLQLEDFLFLEWDHKEGVIRAHGTRSSQSDGISERNIQSRIGTLIGRPVIAGTPSVTVLTNLSESLGLGLESGRSAVIKRLQIRRDKELSKLSRVLYDLEAMRSGA